MIKLEYLLRPGFPECPVDILTVVLTQVIGAAGLGIVLSCRPWILPLCLPCTVCAPPLLSFLLDSESERSLSKVHVTKIYFKILKLFSREQSLLLTPVLNQ